MRIQCDSLKHATILKEKGLESSDAEGLISTFTEMDIFNLYSTNEVNNMLSESIREVFVEQDKKLAEQRRENDLRDLRLVEQKREFDIQIREQRGELLSSRRWTIGTIITVGLSLAAYLSALIHFNH